MSGIMIDPEKLIDFFDRRQEESCGYGYDISMTDELRQFLYDFCHNEVDLGLGFNFPCNKSKESKIEPKRKFKVLDILGSKGLICETPGVLEGYCGHHECYIYYLTYDKDGANKDGEVYPFTLHDGLDYPPEGTYFTIMMDRKVSFPAESKAFKMNDRFIGYHMEVQKQTVDEFFGD